MIEDDLKSGRLRCVVATSSLELGIDMGAVDLVVQVESPPSVASGLQRVGRAGHQVGEISQGVLFPKHRADLVHTAITVERMLEGKIERLFVPANPLDILAQQTVAATALGSIDVEEWFATVRRSAPFASLPRSAFEATLDLLAGRYPSDEFAELRPRIIWDRNAGTIEGRPGAQRLAVTSGGTIPDRGLFGVYIIGTEVEGSASPSSDGKPSRIARQGRPPGGRARRGNGLRVQGGRRLCPRRHQLENRGHHPRPRPRLPRLRPARQAAVLERRLAGPARGPGPRPGRVRPRTVGVRRRPCHRALHGQRAGRLRREQPHPVPERTEARHRRGPQRHHPGGGTVPRRTRRLAGHPPQPVRHARARAVGTRRRTAPAPAVRHGRVGDGGRRRHRPAGAHDGGRTARGRAVPVRSRGTGADCHRGSGRQRPVRLHDSGSAPPVPCCCPARRRASGSRCGSSASGPRSCSMSRGNTPRSRSCWRLSANASRTFTTSRR